MGVALDGDADAVLGQGVHEEIVSNRHTEQQATRSRLKMVPQIHPYCVAGTLDDC